MRPRRSARLRPLLVAAALAALLSGCGLIETDAAPATATWDGATWDAATWR